MVCPVVCSLASVFQSVTDNWILELDLVSACKILIFLIASIADVCDADIHYNYYVLKGKYSVFFKDSTVITAALLTMRQHNMIANTDCIDIRL